MPSPIASSKKNDNSKKQKRKFKIAPNLLKAAKQFDLKPAELVKFLRSKSFRVADWKPNTKIDPDMYIALLKEYDNVFYQQNISLITEKLAEYNIRNIASQSKNRKSEKTALTQQKHNVSIKGNGKVDPIKSVVSSHNTLETFEIEWNNVICEDFSIKVKFRSHYSLPFSVPESRKSFRFIRKYIDNLVYVFKLIRTSC